MTRIKEKSALSAFVFKMPVSDSQIYFGEAATEKSGPIMPIKISPAQMAKATRD